MAQRHRWLAAVSVLSAAVAAGLVVTSASAAPSGTATDHRVPVRAVKASEIQSKITELLRQSKIHHLASKPGALALQDCFTQEVNPSVTTTRIAGANRYETSVCVSLGTWPAHDDPVPIEEKAQAVVLAGGDRFPDALAGGPLATFNHGPLLLTQPNALPSVVLTEIHRILASGGTIYLLGGTAAISDAVKNQLTTDGYNVTRVSGVDRYATAVEIAKLLPAGTNFFFFATGRNFPDGLAAGDAAAMFSFVASQDPTFPAMAVLLTNDKVMPQVTANYLNTFPPGEVLPFTAGGQADAAAVSFFGPLPAELRFVGQNRYETATKIAGSFFTDPQGALLGAGVGLTTGVNFPDALSATANLALFAEPLLLTQPTALNPTTAAFLTNHAGEHDPIFPTAFLDVFGGTTSVSNGVKNAATAAYTP